MRNIPNRGPTNVVDNPNRRVGQVLAMQLRAYGKRLIREFLVIWEGLTREEASWERGETLWRDEEKVLEFLQGNSTSRN